MVVPGQATLGTTNEDGTLKEKQELSADGEIRSSDMEPVINEQGEVLTMVFWIYVRWYWIKIGIFVIYVGVIILSRYTGRFI